MGIIFYLYPIWLRTVSHTVMFNLMIIFPVHNNDNLYQRQEYSILAANSNLKISRNMNLEENYLEFRKISQEKNYFAWEKTPRCH